MGRGSAGAISETFQVLGMRTTSEGEVETAMFKIEMSEFEWLALEAIARLASQHPGKGHKGQAICSTATRLGLASQRRGFEPEDADSILAMLAAKELAEETSSGADEYGKGVAVVFLLISLFPLVE
jgi:hypothetical protein